MGKIRTSVCALARRLSVPAAIAVMMSLPAAAGERIFSGEFALGHDSNVANVRRGGAEREDRFAQVSAAHETVWRLAPSSVMLWQLAAEARGFERYEGLSQATGSLCWRWLHRADGGFHTPLIGATGQIARSDFDSRLRDAWDYRIGVFAQQQLTTRVALRLGWSASWRDAVRDAVFDGGARSATLDLDWQLSRRLAFYAGYQYLDGDLVSTAPNPPAAALAAARATAADDVFAGETAFRLASNADVITLGTNYSLSANWSLDAQLRRAYAEADIGTRYRRDQALVSLLWRF